MTVNAVRKHYNRPIGTFTRKSRISLFAPWKMKVEYIFGVPGEENEDFLFSLDNPSIQFVPTRHEQGAAFIANVWGRLTGSPGVCLSTLGPGAVATGDGRFLMNSRELETAHGEKSISEQTDR